MNRMFAAFAAVSAAFACSPAAAPGGVIATDPQSVAMIQQCTSQGASQGATLAVCTCYVNAIKAGVTPEIFRILSTPENMRTPADLQAVASNPQVLILLQTSLQSCRTQAAQAPSMTPTPYGQAPAMPSTGFGNAGARATFVQNCSMGGQSAEYCGCIADALQRHVSPQVFSIMARGPSGATGADQQMVEAEQAQVVAGMQEAMQTCTQ